MANKLIFIEGPKGVGKSRAISSILDRTYEPWSDEIAHLASEDPYNPVDATTQSMLYTADRRVHMKYAQEWLKVQSVVCDRGPLSTMVYQGVVGGVDLDWIESLNDVAMEGVKVDSTIILYAPFDVMIDRIDSRNKPMTQLEQDQLRPSWEAYEKIRRDPDKWRYSWTGKLRFIDANRPFKEVEADVIALVKRIIKGEA